MNKVIKFDEESENSTQYELPKDSEIFIRKCELLSKRILQCMADKQWLQKDLAFSLDKSEAEISKFLSGTHNYTLRTISKIEAALGKDLFLIPPHDTIQPNVKDQLNPTYTLTPGHPITVNKFGSWGDHPELFDGIYDLDQLKGKPGIQIIQTCNTNSN